MSDNILQKLLKPSARGKIWWVFSCVIILVLVTSLIDFGSYYNKAVDKFKAPFPHVKEVPFRLGLDLLGGTQLIYQADVSALSSVEKGNAVEGVRNVIERRINVFGVSEPNVQINRTSGGDYRIIVEMAGIKDVNQAIKMIGETPLLEFKEQNNEIRKMTPEETKKLEDYNKTAEKQATEVLGKVISGGDFKALALAFSQDEKTKALGGDLGWIIEKDNQEVYNLAKNIAAGKISTDLGRVVGGFEIIKVEDRKVKINPFTNTEEKEVKASHLLICYTNITGCESGLTKEQALAKINKLKQQATLTNFKDLVKQNSTEPGARETGGELGWFGAGIMVKPFEDQVFKQAVGTISAPVETEFGWHLIYKQEERKVEEIKASHIFIKNMTKEDIIGKQTEWKNTELTGKNLKSAAVEFNSRDGSPEVSLVFDDQGAKMFEDITARNISKPVAIYLDGYPISVPKVNEKITGGKAVISGKFDITEAKVLTQRLNAGALPVPIELVSQQTIGASLGQQSVTDSMKAGLIGFIVIVLFMILFYRLPGLMAVFALIVYSLLVFAIFKIGFSMAALLLVGIFLLIGITINSWFILFAFLSYILLYFIGGLSPVTLTLAGLTGAIVSVGMAVDANILIFARMKEEIANGQPLSLAIENGFKRAWPSIRDSNFNTLITCFILIMFTTSAVKGFAITLGLGVIISMFTAIFITRNFLNLIPSAWLEKRHGLITTIKK
ncbi:peptidylprolyl isomerase [Patescibacteria group bacterium]|nr:peptidylprolyl isomerase [Patescibacteria group bacterium]MBU1663608.1 peptidylprolyl isomerase [Patescibacteria group bacterium]MBU1934128.1 peptidylprolyl isomerase [Patescibacteria group bacterium]MBU2007903.1 peptidylprolyl isomerase [Patescibacteria group bacterium]MBU2233592.1 peptidylprolyl isomerase [Patescibacteria group bacterium]